jgi:hypothetical protein
MSVRTRSQSLRSDTSDLTVSNRTKRVPSADTPLDQEGTHREYSPDRRSPTPASEHATPVVTVAAPSLRDAPPLDELVAQDNSEQAAHRLENLIHTQAQRQHHQSGNEHQEGSHRSSNLSLATLDEIWRRINSLKGQLQRNGEHPVMNP